MKTKKPDSPDGREERIVALLAGEVSPKEATELRRLMESEPSLMEFYNLMNRTMGLVRAAKAAEGGTVEEPKLSESRRAALLARFKQPVRRTLAAKPQPRRFDWVVPLALAAAVIFLFGAIAVPNFVKSRAAAPMAQRVTALSGEEIESRDRNGGMSVQDFNADVQVDEKAVGDRKDQPADAVAENSFRYRVDIDDRAGEKPGNMNGRPALAEAEAANRWHEESRPAIPQSRAGSAASAPPTPPVSGPVAAGGSLSTSSRFGRGDGAVAVSGQPTPTAAAKPLSPGQVLSLGDAPVAGRYFDAGLDGAKADASGRGNLNLFLAQQQVAAQAAPGNLAKNTETIVSENFGEIRSKNYFDDSIVRNGQAGGGGFGGGLGGTATGSTTRESALGQVQLGVDVSGVDAVKDQNYLYYKSPMLLERNQPAPAPAASDGYAATTSDRSTFYSLLTDGRASGRQAGNTPAVTEPMPELRKSISAEDAKKSGAVVGVTLGDALLPTPAAPAPAQQPAGEVAGVRLQGGSPPAQPTEAKAQKLDDLSVAQGSGGVIAGFGVVPQSVPPQKPAEPSIREEDTRAAGERQPYFRGFQEKENRAFVEESVRQRMLKRADEVKRLNGENAPVVAEVEQAAEKQEAQKAGVETLARRKLQLGEQLAEAKDKAAPDVSVGQLALTNSIHHNGKLAIGGSDVALKEVDRAVSAANLAKINETSKVADLEAVQAQPKRPPSAPLPEIQTQANPFSTFSLNVSDVSFKLAAATLEQGQMPEPGSIRSEEFVNALKYHDSAPSAGERVSLNWERARNSMAHNRDLIRLSVQTAAWGREQGRPLNLVLLLDSSGSMERSDRVLILRQALQVLARQLTPQDRVSVVAFARTPRLWVDGMAGGNPDALIARVGQLNPEGGTNLELALGLGYETAEKHFVEGGVNRVILLTDGAANLGNVDVDVLRRKVEAERKKNIALDCFGVGWEGFNDELLEQLSRNGDGRYGFLNSPAEAASEFAGQLAGALRVAAGDVKTQIEFNPERVTTYRQIGYEKHQLTKEQFRDNTVDAAEIGAAESGTALYSIQVNPKGRGPLGVARVRYKVPETGRYEEREWLLNYSPAVASMEAAPVSMRLASVAGLFAEVLAQNPYSAGVTLANLEQWMNGVVESFPRDPRPQQLATMIRQARTASGR